MEIDKGLAALIAAGIAALFSLLSVLISTRSARKQVSDQHKLSRKNTIEEEKRERINKQLSEFYNPIVTLLSVNRDIFERIGPRSEARASGVFNDEETAEVWKNLCKTVVIPNNLKVCDLIEKNIHLINNHSYEKDYFDFLTHAYAYQIFQDSAYEAYRLFTYPSGFLEKVVDQRNLLVKDFDKTYGKEKRSWYQCLFLVR
ncbi:hypothetical protein [Endozoicomonas lisbonensis]|uniref:DUF4760 domain-containing protein n=1 Tax=Endozoicomonas lisbonensis TaxID=3120522 RepID=A0ABV2SCV6_9GAMM